MVEDLRGLRRAGHGALGVAALVGSGLSGWSAYTRFAEDMPKINSELNADLTEIYVAMYGHAPKSPADLELFRNIVNAHTRGGSGTYNGIDFDVEKYNQAALETGNARVVQSQPYQVMGNDESGAPAIIDVPVKDSIVTTPEELLVSFDQTWALGVVSVVGVVVLGLTSAHFLGNAKKGWKA